MKKAELIVEFAIQEYPVESQLKYWVAYLEGELIIRINGRIFFQESNMLLIEFGMALRKWLSTVEESGLGVPMRYFTMDHDEEEGAILALEPVTSNCYQIHSIWQAFSCQECIDEQELMAVATLFIERLDQELDRERLLRLSGKP